MKDVLSQFSLAAVAALTLAACVASPASTLHPGARYADIPSGAYAVVAEIRAKPGKEDALRAATLPLVAKVRSEPNNLVYFLHEDRAVPGRFVFYEIFATEADFRAHNATPHVQAWFSRLPELAEGDVTVTHMKIHGNDAVVIPERK